MGPLLFSVLVLAMYHPADIFVNQMRIAEYAISLLPSGSHIHIGFLAYEYDDLFDGSKEEYENSRCPVLAHFNFESYVVYINASFATFNYKHNFKGPPGLPQIGLILATESRVNGDMKGIKDLKKKTYVVVETKSSSKGLADLATSPDHVFSPYGFDGNRLSNLLLNDAQQACDTDMYLPAPGSKQCQLCRNACDLFLPLNCTNPEIQRQCKYFTNELVYADNSESIGETTGIDYPTPVFFHDSSRLTPTMIIVASSVGFVIIMIVSLALCASFGPAMLRERIISIRTQCLNFMELIIQRRQHTLIINIDTYSSPL